MPFVRPSSAAPPISYSGHHAAADQVHSGVTEQVESGSDLDDPGRSGNPWSPGGPPGYAMAFRLIREDPLVGGGV